MKNPLEHDDNCLFKTVRIGKAVISGFIENKMGIRDSDSCGNRNRMFRQKAFNMLLLEPLFSQPVFFHQFMQLAGADSGNIGGIFNFPHFLGKNLL